MRGPTLAVLIVLIAVLFAVLALLVIQWTLMKREQRRIEDLVELRARQGGSVAATATSGAAAARRSADGNAESKEEG